MKVKFECNEQVAYNTVREYKQKIEEVVIDNDEKVVILKGVKE